MFNLLRKHVIQTRILLERDPTTIFCILQTPIFVRAKSTTTTTDQISFRVSYLINSCGLSQEKAISASKKLRFKTPTKPDSVLALLRTTGFTKTHISKFVEKCPQFLSAKPDKTLKPKFDFFNSLGISGSDLAHMISGYPYVLELSLEKIIIRFDFLKTVVQRETKVIAMLKCSMTVLSKDLTRHLIPNVALLRTYGVPDSNIQMLLVTQPRSLLRSTSSFNEVVEEVRKTDIDPSQNLFVTAVRVLTSMSKSTLEAKLDVFRKWGWSENDIRCAFRKTPQCMTISVKKIMHAMNFLVNKMGYDSLQIAKQPIVLRYSMENRIIPRCLVMKLLKFKGLVKKDCSLYYQLKISEKVFFETFVSKFEENVPDLLDAYQGRGRWMIKDGPGIPKHKKRGSL